MSSSKVMIFPPALMILALADSVTLKAQTLRAGTSIRRTSSVMVPTRTAVLSYFPFIKVASLEMETGAFWILECLSLWRTVLEKLVSVLLERNLNN